MSTSEAEEETGTWPNGCTMLNGCTYAQRLYWYKCVRLSRLLAFECTLNHCTFISFHQHLWFHSLSWCLAESYINEDQQWKRAVDLYIFSASNPESYSKQTLEEPGITCGG